MNLATDWVHSADEPVTRSNVGLATSNRDSYRRPSRRAHLRVLERLCTEKRFPDEFALVNGIAAACFKIQIAASRHRHEQQPACGCRRREELAYVADRLHSVAIPGITLGRLVSRNFPKSFACPGVSRHQRVA